MNWLTPASMRVGVSSKVTAGDLAAAHEEGLADRRRALELDQHRVRDADAAACPAPGAAGGVRDLAQVLGEEGVQEAAWPEQPSEVEGRGLAAAAPLEGVAAVDGLATEGQDLGGPEIVELGPRAARDQGRAVLGEGGDEATHRLWQPGGGLLGLLYLLALAGRQCAATAGHGGGDGAEVQLQLGELLLDRVHGGGRPSLLRTRSRSQTKRRLT